MILVLGGTSESREITELLVGKGYKVIVSAATPYGGALLERIQAAEIITNRMDESDIVNLIKAKDIRILIDATHPFAQLATINAQNACKTTGTAYIRFERQDYIIPEHSLIHKVSSYEEAAKKAVELASKSILVTTGIKTLPLFVQEAKLEDKRIIARILPDLNSLKLCLEMGIPPKDIIAMQGPFSTQMNAVILTDYKAEVIVTKDSGIAGGTAFKIDAAIELSIPVVIIERPRIVNDAINSTDKLLEKILDYEGNEYIENRHSIT